MHPVCPYCHVDLSVFLNEPERTEHVADCERIAAGLGSNEQKAS